MCETTANLIHKAHSYMITGKQNLKGKMQFVKKKWQIDSESIITYQLFMLESSIPSCLLSYV